MSEQEEMEAIELILKFAFRNFWKIFIIFSLSFSFIIFKFPRPDSKLDYFQKNKKGLYAWIPFLR